MIKVYVGVLTLTINVFVTGQTLPQSKWGVNDEIGAVNYLTPQKVQTATKLVTKGKVYSLGTEFNSSFPAFRHRNFNLISMQPGQQAGETYGKNQFTYNDEFISGWTGVGTQINGLGHYGRDYVYYNNNKAKDFATIKGVTKLGLEKVPPIVARAVLLDMASYYGTDIVKEGIAFNKAEIDAAAKRQNIVIQEGDVVLFYTGWMKLIGKDNNRFVAVGPGIGEEGARYLSEKKVVAIGSDTPLLEATPHEDTGKSFPVNQLLATEYGVHVLELIKTDELIKDKVYEFLFVLGHPKITGATQVQINPVGIK